MKTDKMTILEEKTAAVDKRLVALGIKDTVNEFLNSAQTKADVESIFTTWLNDLKAYVGKMPEVCHAATDKFLEDIEKGKETFMYAVSLEFKCSQVGVWQDMKDRMHWGSMEEKLNTPIIKQLWRGIVCSTARDLISGMNMTAKVEIAVEAHSAVENSEQANAFVDVLEAEPEGETLAALVGREVAYINLCCSIMERMGAVLYLAAKFGGMSKEEPSE